MRILVTAGGSGGHLFPALSFLEAMAQRDPRLEALVMVPERHVACEGLSRWQVRTVPVRGVGLRVTTENLRQVVRLGVTGWRTFVTLAHFRPDAVVGFGSVVSLPAVLGGWLFRKRTVIHEQNAVPGRATRVMAVAADVIAVSFPETARYFLDYRRKVSVTGNPLRSAMVPMAAGVARRQLGLDEGRTTVLVAGGSQGAARINEAFLGFARDRGVSLGIQVVHLCGSADRQRLEEGYRAAGIPARVEAFFEAMQVAYSAADVLVARAGALTVTEAARFGLPSVFVPYPHAHRHQYANARVLADKGAAVIVDDDRCTKDILAEALVPLLADGSLRRRMGDAARAAVPAQDAAAKLAEAVCA